MRGRIRRGSMENGGEFEEMGGRECDESGRVFGRVVLGSVWCLH